MVCWVQQAGGCSSGVPGWASPSRQNLTTRLTASLAGGGGLPRLDTSRLRATWLAEAAGLIGLGCLHNRRRDQLLPAARRPSRRARTRR